MNRLTGSDSFQRGLMRNLIATAIGRAIVRLLVIAQVTFGLPILPAYAAGALDTAAVPALADLTVGSTYPLVSSTRVTRTLFDFTYKAQIINGGAQEFADVAATVTSKATTTAIMDGNVSFGRVPAGATVTSQDTFTIRQDRTVPFNPADLTWTVRANRAPVANAGSDQTVPVNAEVTLDGRASTDADGNALTYAWRLANAPAGSQTILRDSTSAQPTLIPDKPGDYGAELVVNDGQANSVPDTVTVSTLNSRPVANAGPDQRAAVGTVVTLDGSRSSDVDGDTLGHAWTLVGRPDESAEALNAPTTFNPTLKIDRPGTYVAQLIVNDGKVNSDPDAVTVSTEKSKPVANAGPDRSARVGDTVTLDGSASADADGDPLTYRWSWLDYPGNEPMLSDPAAIKPGFKVNEAGSYTAQLIVRDGTVDSAPDTVNVSTGNSKPVASAGPDVAAFVGDPVTLDGDGSSDPDGDPLTHEWALTTRPAGSTTVLGATTPGAEFIPDVVGDYVVQLIVSDGKSHSEPDTAVVTARTPTNRNPRIISTPGTTAATVGKLYSYDVNAIDDDGDTLSYSLTAFPPGMTISPNTGLIQWTPQDSQTGSHPVAVLVSDGKAGTATQGFTVQVAAPAGNQPPQVDAGADQTITLPTANLAGAATDDGLPNPPAALTYMWSVVSGPASVTFASPNALATTATFFVPGEHVLRLTASDSLLAGSDDMTITVNDSGPELRAIPDKTIPLGTRLRVGMVADAPNVQETLTYALVSAPSGAGLDLTRVIDWTPTDAQLGANPFTARVTDSKGRSDTKSFTVTVTQASRPPVLAEQADATLPVGITFSRTLTATDPDAGDTLTFALVSGPAGMTLAGATLNWPTASHAPGDYPVTVKVTDTSGAADAKRFVITLSPNPPPVANPDRYETRLGETLTVPAPGVLGNDVAPNGGALTAARLTDPTKGALTAFNADGGFTYQAPPTLPGPVFQPVVKAKADPATFGIGFWQWVPTVVDVDRDGIPEIITNDLNSGGTGIAVWHFKNGVLEQLWNRPGFPAPFDDCSNYAAGGLPQPFAAGDIDDSGEIALVLAVSCVRDNPGDPGHAKVARYMAVNGRDGAPKWLSPTMSDARQTNPSTGQPYAFDMTAGTIPLITRLRPGESPSIVFGRELHYSLFAGKPQCDQVVPDWPAYTNCRAVFVLDGKDGTLRQKMAAEGYISTVTPYIAGYPAVVAADLEGNGKLNFVYGSSVFNPDGSTRWSVTDPNKGAKIWWNGLGNFDDTPDIEIVRVEGRADDYVVRLAVYKADGRLLWRTPSIAGGSDNGIPVVADVDGSGRPAVVLNFHQYVCAIDYRGNYKWCYDGGVDTSPHNIGGGVRIAVYDLDGDGVPEVIVPLFNERLVFLDGATGAVKYDFNMAAANGSPPGVLWYPHGIGSPLIADFAGNGHASILSLWSANTGAWRMNLVGAQNDDWQPARKIFNQTSYHVGNVEDDGTIPPSFVNNFATPATNVFGTQAQVLKPVDPRLKTQTTFTYQASSGALASAPATVTIDIQPQNRPPKFVSTPPTRWSGVNPSAFDYAAQAVDPDVGDTLTYSIRVASGDHAADCTIHPTTGAFHCTQLRRGDYGFVIVATDSQGATAYQTISLIQSTGAAAVPDVVGQPQATAETTITGAGFTVGDITSMHNAAPVGQVLAQSPAAGTSTFLGEVMTLTVSKGPTPVSVPFVVGQALTVANTQLTGAGFTVVVNRVFSNTAQANEVIAQTPAAGTSLAPTPTTPVTLTVSSGNGLALRLNRSIATADQTITVAPTAFDVDGNPTALPALTYAVTPALTPFAGPLPAVSGVTITPATTTTGAFTITATDAANARSASVDFVVTPPRIPGGATHGESYARMAEALDAIFALKQSLIAARDANDQPQMKALLQQMVTLWRTVDLDDLKISMPLVAANGFAPTLADLKALGLGPTADDLVIKQVLRDAINDIRAWRDGLRAAGTTMAQLNALADQFSTRAARLDGLIVSEYGGIYNQPEYTLLLSHLIPDFHEALFEEIAAATGMARRNPAFSHLLSASGGDRSHPMSTLAELLVTQATNYVVEKIMEQASERFRNAKQFAVDTMKQAAWTAAVVGITGHLKQFVQGGDVYEVISGASLSFRVFNEPNPNQGIIEVPGNFDYPELTSVMIVGPDTAADVTNGIKDVYEKMKEGFSYGLDPNNNPKGYKNYNDAKKHLKEFMDRMKAIQQSVTGLQDTIDNAYQTADAVLPGCIFTSDPTCAQLIYNDGFRPVYRYTPPPGFQSLGGLPAAIIFIVQNQYTGLMYFGTPLFLPAPRNP